MVKLGYHESAGGLAVNNQHEGILPQHFASREEFPASVCIPGPGIKRRFGPMLQCYGAQPYVTKIEWWPFVPLNQALPHTAGVISHSLYTGDAGRKGSEYQVSRISSSRRCVVLYPAHDS
jgi:hypothetical protein